MRFNFDNPQLSGGLSAIPVLIGLFAVSQLLVNVEESRLDTRPSGGTGAPKIRVPYRLVMRDMWHEKRNVVRSSMVGTFIGTLPAAGAESANFISYDRAKKAEKRNPEKYGKGHPGGIVASETSNNAVAGGAFIPTITLGIPGDVAQAVMMGALILHGIAPGPGLFERQPVLVNSIYLSIVIAALCVLVVQTLLLPFLARVTLVPKAILVPCILVLTAVGSFAMNNRIFDIWVVVAFGIIGFLLVKLSVPLGPMILGLILGSTLEEELLRALQLSDTLSTFVTRPISLTFLILAVGSIGFSLYKAHRARKTASAPRESVTV